MGDLERNNTRQGILLIVAGLGIAAITGAIMKVLTETLTPVQITWFRFLGFAIVILPFALWKVGSSTFRPARPWMQLIRGVTMASATVAFVQGVQTVEYANAIAILYAYPFLLTLLAVIFLGEKVSWAGWMGVIGGFVGVYMIMQPDFTRLNTGASFIFVCAVIVSIQLVLNRKLGSSSHPLVTSFWGATTASVLLSLMLPMNWNSVSPSDWMWIGLMILSGAVNQTLLVYAFAKAEASALAPFTYFEIVAALILGLLFFGTLPDMLAWAGIALIIVSGLTVARVLSVQQTPKRQPKF